jgi:acyl-CoA synthetase (AMP-forming)/AMP-acid ligase II
MSSDFHDWNIFSVIKSHSASFPAKIMMTVDGDEISYGQFIKNTINISSALINTGAVKNDKIGIIIPNSILWYELFWAVSCIGCIPVPLDPQVGEWELSNFINLTGIKFCFSIPRYRANPLLENLRNITVKKTDLSMVVVIDTEFSGLNETNTQFIPFSLFTNNIPDNILKDDFFTSYRDLLMYACTSGTTGNPKIIAVEHGGFNKAQKDMGVYLNFGKNDIMLLGMPLYHQGGFGMGLQVLLSGGSVIYQSKFDPELFLKTIQEKKVTAIQLTATLAKILLSVPGFTDYDISSVKLAYFAGEVLPDDIARTFYEKLDIRVVNIIGSSETCTMVVWDSDFDRDYDVNTFRRLEFTDFKIIDDKGHEVSENQSGTILIHTDGILREYIKNPDETKDKIRIINNERWFNTGDLGIRLPGKRLKFIGRSKRIIKRGGNLVFPEEIESFLLTHPLINAVAVIKEDNDIFGEMIICHIQPVKDAVIKRQEIIKFCKGKLSSYKIPDVFKIEDDIPKDIGKIQFKYINKK